MPIQTTCWVGKGKIEDFSTALRGFPGRSGALLGIAPSLKRTGGCPLLLKEAALRLLCNPSGKTIPGGAGFSGGIFIQPEDANDGNRCRQQ